jgi:DNA mismatch endonuclease (patch repair protein)
VFVDGCFWHGCPRCYRRPKSNTAYWNAKRLYNRDRDRLVNRQLQEEGIRVVRVWECQVKSGRTIRRISTALSQAAD